MPPTAPTRHRGSPRGSPMSRLPRRQSKGGGGTLAGKPTGVGRLEEWGQERKEDMDDISGRDPELSFGSGSGEADRALPAQANRPSHLPSQCLNMRTNHSLMVAPKSWQDGSHDLQVPSGPPCGLRLPAARRLRKPQQSHYEDPSAAWRWWGSHFWQLTDVGPSQKQQGRGLAHKASFIHTKTHPPTGHRSSAPHGPAAGLVRVCGGAGASTVPLSPVSAFCASAPTGLIFQPPPPASAVCLSSTLGLALFLEDSSLFFPACPESEILHLGRS